MVKVTKKQEDKWLKSFEKHPLGAKFIYNYFFRVANDQNMHVNITCKECGETYSKRCSKHKAGCDCTKCAIKKKAEKSRLSEKGKISLEECRARIELIHGKATFELLEMERRGRSHIYVYVSCKRCDREPWWVPLQTLTKGCGCKECYFKSLSMGANKYITLHKLENNFLSQAPHKLYITQLYNKTEKFFKIGRTSKTVKQRFAQGGGIPYKYRTLMTVEDTMYNIIQLENAMHNVYDNFSYLPKIFFCGRTECFSELPDLENTLKNTIERLDKEQNIKYNAGKEKNNERKIF